MSAYSLKSHGTYLGYIIRRFYFRALIAAYAFFVFAGVMPKAPPRSPYQGSFDYMILTVGNSLGGLVALALLMALVCVVWSAIAAFRGLKPPTPPVPDEAPDGGPL